MTFPISASIFNIFSMGSDAILNYVIGIVVLFASLSLHEYAHAYAADRLGDSTAREMGRLTLNPLAHMDPMGTIFILLGAPVGWARPVPINSNRFDRKHTVKKGIAIVSIAGVTANLLLSAVSYLLFGLTFVFAYHSGALQDSSSPALVNLVNILMLIFEIFFYRNIYLAIFNLLPVPPLDGFKFFGTMLPNRIYFRIMQYERYFGMVFLLLIVFGRGALFSLMNWLATPVIWLISTPINQLINLLIR